VSELPNLPRNLLVGDRLSDDSWRFIMLCLSGMLTELRKIREMLGEFEVVE
jgi:hypothetical protein